MRSVYLIKFFLRFNDIHHSTYIVIAGDFLEAVRDCHLDMKLFYAEPTFIAMTSDIDKVLKVT